MFIFSLLLLVSTAYARFTFPHDNDDKLQPFVTPSQSRRICTELCMSGLGGDPCGDSCMDIAPSGMPIEFPSDENKQKNQTRRDTCAILCPNNLGYPLCGCDVSTQNTNPNFKPDFVQICSYYCLKHKYRLYGCQPCNVYKEANEKNGLDLFVFQKKANMKNEVDWNEWCRQQCMVGNGGAACNCDILPFSAHI